MSNIEIVFLAMIVSTTLMIMFSMINGRIKRYRRDKCIKRIKELEVRIKNNELEIVLIDVANEPSRIENITEDFGFIVDNKRYDSRNALFMSKDNRFYIIGKKEDFVIGLVGANLLLSRLD